MSNAENGDKILGFVPKDMYVLYTYYLVLASSGLGLLLTVLSLVGVFLPIAGLVTLAAFIGVIMALAGYFGFREEFNALDQNHLFYLSVLFGVLFLLGLILSNALAILGIILVLIMVLYDAASFALVFAGFNAYKHGRSMTLSKDGLVSEIQLAIKRA